MGLYYVYCLEFPVRAFVKQDFDRKKYIGCRKVHSPHKFLTAVNFWPYYKITVKKDLKELYEARRRNWPVWCNWLHPHENEADAKKHEAVALKEFDAVDSPEYINKRAE